MSEYPRGHAQNPFTQADVDAVQVNANGKRGMPKGHYVAGCCFKNTSYFVSGCHFGERCRFSEASRFGERSHFGAYCSFGEWCRFGERCSFGEWCIFDPRCRFEDGKIPDDWQQPYFAVDRIGSAQRRAYFFSFGGVIHVRAGCFFGGEAAFLEKLDADGDARKSRHYRLALELARDILGNKE